MCVWASAHIDLVGGGATLCVAVCEADKAVLVDVCVESRGTLDTLRTTLLEEVKLLASHPKYSEANIWVAMDANPVSAVEKQQAMLREYKQVKWVHDVAGMPAQPGVTANVRQRREAWRVLRERGRVGLYRPATAEWLIQHPLQMSGISNQVDSVLSHTSTSACLLPPSRTISPCCITLFSFSGDKSA